MLLIGKGEVLKETREKLSDNVDVKDLGEVSKFRKIMNVNGQRKNRLVSTC
jgi:hypothetical protein